MKLRFPENVSVSLRIPDEIRDIEIPPMLLISFLENAFKHGVSYQNESFVFVSIVLTDQQLICVIRNSKINNKEKENVENKYSGIGLANIKQSLKLLFGNDYSLTLKENEKEYEVQLIIPTYEN